MLPAAAGGGGTSGAGAALTGGGTAATGAEAGARSTYTMRGAGSGRTARHPAMPDAAPTAKAVTSDRGRASEPPPRRCLPVATRRPWSFLPAILPCRHPGEPARGPSPPEGRARPASRRAEESSRSRASGLGSSGFIASLAAAGGRPPRTLPAPPAGASRRCGAGSRARARSRSSAARRARAE